MDPLTEPHRRCTCRRHPIWLALDAIAWLVIDRTILTRQSCRAHGQSTTTQG